MPNNLESTHGGTIAYSATCFHVEALDNLMTLYGKAFRAMTNKKPLPTDLRTEIDSAMAEVVRTRQHHETAKAWALQEAPTND